MELVFEGESSATFCIEGGFRVVYLVWFMHLLDGWNGLNAGLSGAKDPEVSEFDRWGCTVNWVLVSLK